MRSRLRQLVLVLAIICFLAMTSGLALYLHLGHHKDLSNHDSAHCLLCHAIAVNGSKFCIESHPAVIHGGHAVTVVEEIREVLPHQFIPAVLAPRPPPFSAVFSKS